jgi:hypothetical protein
MPPDPNLLRDELGDGIKIPEYSVEVPWLVSRDELFEIVPKNLFSFSEAGNWPCLAFTLCGFHGLFGFNFVSDRKDRLTEIQFRNFRSKNLWRTFRRARDQLTAVLGRPNLVDKPLGQQTWRADPLWIESFVTRQPEVSAGPRRNCHFLSVRYNPELRAN